MSPSVQTDAASVGSCPRPWSSTQAATFSPISAQATIGVWWLGFSSRIGNIAAG